LKTIDLSYNIMKDDGVLAIADALTVNSTLCTLKLEGNDVEDDVKKVLCESWDQHNRVGTLEI